MSNALDRMLSVAGDTIGFLERVRSASETLRGGAAAPRTVSRARAFGVIEAIEETGEPCWIVTNGYDRAVCSSSAFAQKVRGALG